MTLRTPLSTVRGLGSSKSGTHHWWVQRLTAVALVPLGLWFVISVIGLVGAEHAVVVAWLGDPVTAGLLIALVIATFYHAALGMQVVYEDYVGNLGLRMAVDIATKLILALLGLIAIVSIVMIALGG
ncbi:MAG: succinate dehydrogenase, hydrophobic membrane anchor protein [Rhodospirillaceae bacterium]|nr:succinate dehydrogenase, hydrophobic membrane anchor protein [Rhodospirillaceae bacterium]